MIKPIKAIKLKAKEETFDQDGNSRVKGEEWLVTMVGVYKPGADEEVVGAYVPMEKVREREGGRKEREQTNGFTPYMQDSPDAHTN